MKQISENQLIDAARSLRERLAEADGSGAGSASFAAADPRRTDAAKPAAPMTQQQLAAAQAAPGSGTSYAPAQAAQSQTSQAAQAAPAKPAAPAAPGAANWKQIYDMNKSVIGANPNLIKPGQQLKMPDGSTYTVKAGDNLTKIASGAKPAATGANAAGTATGADMDAATAPQEPEAPAPAPAPAGVQAQGDDEGNTTLTRPDGSTMVLGPDGKQIMPGSNPNLPQNQGAWNTLKNWATNQGEFQKPGGWQGAPAKVAPAAAPAAGGNVTSSDGTPVTDGSGQPVKTGVQESVGFQADELNRIVSLVHYR